MVCMLGFEGYINGLYIHILAAYTLISCVHKYLLQQANRTRMMFEVATVPLCSPKEEMLSGNTPAVH